MDEVLDRFQPAIPGQSPEGEMFGHFLSSARTQRQVSIEELSWATKIRMEYLLALESGDFSVLPGDIFAKGYIKSYARYIGLDPNEAIAFYLQCVKGHCEEPAEVPAPEPVSLMTRFFFLIEGIKRLVTGRDDLQIY